MSEFPTIRGSVRWAIRRWRARLRRDGAAIALLVLLLFGVGEPLLCIVHCYLWLPIAFPQFVAAHHHHNVDLSTGQTTASSRLTTAGSIFPTQESPTPACHLHTGSGPASLPFSVSPTPVHEMIPPLLLLLIPLLLLLTRLAAPPGDAPLMFISPPFRPPIPLAG